MICGVPLWTGHPHCSCCDTGKRCGVPHCCTEFRERAEKKMPKVEA